jgi:hypothetical protein
MDKIYFFDIIWLWLYKNGENFSAAFTGGQSEMVLHEPTVYVFYGLA